MRFLNPGDYLKVPMLLSGILSMSLAFPLAAQAQSPPLHVHDKKIIEFGWDAPTPGFVKSHLADMEKRPFDGLVLFPGRGVPNLFKPSIWGPEVVEEEMKGRGRGGEFVA